MLSREKRLRAAEVREIIRLGSVVRGTLLSARHRQGTHTLRAAVVVSKKLAKRAVDRNRLRRAMYRALEQYEKGGTLLAHGDVVLFLQKIPPPPLTPAFAEDLALLLKKIYQRHV